jgi:hypothetical protein
VGALPFNPESIKLGKKLGHVEDRRTFKLRTFLPRTLPTPPDRSAVGGTTVEFPMFANDRYGDCTVASHGHRVIAQERSSRQAEIQVTDEDVLAVYSAVTGFDRNRPQTDNGAYMLDVLNYMRKHGLGREKDGTPHTIGAFVAVPTTNAQQMKIASWMFGGLYLGIWLPLSAASQATWDVSPDGSTSGRRSFSIPRHSTTGNVRSQQPSALLLLVVHRQVRLAAEVGIVLMDGEPLDLAPDGAHVRLHPGGGGAGITGGDGVQDRFVAPDDLFPHGRLGGGGILAAVFPQQP